MIRIGANDQEGVSAEGTVAVWTGTAEKFCLHKERAMAGVELDNDIEQELRAQITHLQLLLDIDAKIGMTLDPHKILQLILSEGLRIIGCDRGDIALLDEPAGELVLACAQGPLTEYIPTRVNAHEGISGRVLREKRIQKVADVQQDADYLALLVKHPAETPYGTFLRSFCSTVKLPLLLQGRPIGVFCAHSPCQNNFAGHTVTLLAALIHRAVWAVHNARTHEQTRQALWEHASEVSALSDIHHLLTTDTDPDTLKAALYRLSAQKALDITAAYSSSIRILDQTTRRLRFAAQAGEGWTPETLGRSYGLDEKSAATWAIETRKPYRIDDVQQDSDPHFVRLFAWGRAHVSVPLIHRKRALGVLSVDAKTACAFSDEHVRSLVLLAQAITLGLAQIELLERAGLYELEKILREAQNVKELCERVVHEVCELLPADAGSLFLLDRQVGDYVLQATTDLAPTPDVRISYRPGEGLTGWIAQHKTPLRVKDCGDKAELQRTASDLQWRGKYPEGVNRFRKPRRYLGVPLFAEQEVIGVLRVVRRQEHTPFTPADEHLLSAAAGRIALAIDRLRLLQQREQRVAELKVFSELHKACAQRLSADEVFRVILDKGLKLLGCDSGHIRLREGDSDRLLLAKRMGERNPPLVRTLGEGTSGRVAQNPRTVYIRDTRSHPMIQSLVDQDRLPEFVRSGICVPLKVDSQVLGTLVVHKPVPHGFTKHQIRLLENMAAIAASAIRTSWLFEVLNNIADAVTSCADMEGLYDQIYRQVKRVIPTNTFYVALYEEQDEKLTFQYIIDDDVRYPGCRARIEDKYFQYVVIKKCPLRINRDPRYIDQESPLEFRLGAVTKPASSLLIVPIMLPGGRVKGIMSAQSYTPNVYVEEHLNMLSIIASQIAIGIRGAQRLFSARKDLEKGLHRRSIVQALATTENLHDMLEVVLGKALGAVNCERGIVRLVDEDGKHLILARSQGLPSERIPIAISVETGIAGQAVTSGQAVLINDTSGHAGFMQWRQKVNHTYYGSLLEEHKSMLAAPLRAGKIIGVLLAYKVDVSGFQLADKETLQEIADYVATPIRDAVLKESARLLWKMTDYFHNLLPIITDEDQVLQNALNYALTLTGCQSGHISVLDQSEQWLIQRATAGENTETLPQQRQPVDVGIHGRALATHQMQLVSCVSKDRDFQAYLAKLDDNKKAGLRALNEVLVVPLMIQDSPYGILCLHSPKSNTFTTVQMTLMEKLGHFISELLMRCQEHVEQLRKNTMAELGELSGIVAHEINTPLHIILMKAERLLKHATDEQQQQKLQEIMYEAKRGGAIVAQLLSYAKRSHNPEKKSDLTAMVSNALQLACHWLEEKNIKLYEQLSPSLPAAALGESEIKQVFFNLLRNAVDAMPDGGILTVQTRLAEDGHYVELLVRDTGGGILPDMREKIFHPYFTTKEPGQGTGLGLSVCREIVCKYGGTITVEEPIGQGSMFVVRFPIERRDVYGSNHSR